MLCFQNGDSTDAQRGLLTQLFLDLSNRKFPGFVLLDGQTLQCLDHPFGRVLRLQIGFEDIYVAIEPLKTLPLNGGDAFHHFTGIETGSGVVKGLDVFAGGLRSTYVSASALTRNLSRLVPGTYRSTSSPPTYTWLTTYTVLECGG